MLADRILDELVRRERVGIGLLVRDGERAELALHTADVGLVQIQVLDEVDAVVAPAYTPCEVGQFAEGKDVVALHQRHAVLEVETLSRLHLVADGRKQVGAFQQSH